MPSLRQLVAVFEEARALVGLAGNDFAWSYWEDCEAAVAEIDAVLATLRAGRLPGDLTLRIFFAPTGPLQEVSLSSGWGDAFLDLADRFDAAMASADEPPAAPPGDACACLADPARLVAERDLGSDSRFADVSVLACPDCGRRWLRYLHEVESIGGSGRWYLGEIPPAMLASIDAEGARALLEALEWYYVGGSYYDGTIGRGAGTIYI
jgi:hypothetical protein